MPASGSESYAEDVTSMNETDFVALATGPQGGRIRLDIQLHVDPRGPVSGSVTAVRA
jgi:hypothetical protein